MKLIKYLIILILVVSIISCTNEESIRRTSNMLETKIAQYAKTEIKYDENLLR